jgi:hypothetical protein
MSIIAPRKTNLGFKRNLTIEVDALVTRTQAEQPFHLVLKQEHEAQVVELRDGGR